MSLSFASKRPLLIGFTKLIGDFLEIIDSAQNFILNFQTQTDVFTSHSLIHFKKYVCVFESGCRVASWHVDRSFAHEVGSLGTKTHWHFLLAVWVCGALVLLLLYFLRLVLFILLAIKESCTWLLCVVGLLLGIWVLSGWLLLRGGWSYLLRLDYRQKKAIKS